MSVIVTTLYIIVRSSNHEGHDMTDAGLSPDLITLESNVVYSPLKVVYRTNVKSNMASAVSTRSLVKNTSEYQDCSGVNGLRSDGFAH